MRRTKPNASAFARPPRLTAAGSLLTAALASLPALALPDKTWVVAIGANHGIGADPLLVYAERDATEMAEELKVHGRVSSLRTTLITGEDATTVRRALQEVNARIREQSSGQPTALLVFYSGHGDAENLHIDGTTLGLDELKMLVQGSPASMRLLVIDACRSGTVTRVKGVTPAASFPIQVVSEAAPEGMAIITSSAANESSQESDQLRGSFFTHHFINAMRGAADEDGDGRVTLDEAYAYAYAQTLRSSGQTMSLQHPTYSWSVKGRDPLILSRPGETHGQLGRLRLHGGASYLVMEKREGGPIVAELAAQGDHAAILLPAGHYFVQQREPAEFREYNVDLQVGKDTYLDDLPYRAVRYDQLVRMRGSPIQRTHGLMFLGGGRGQTIAGEGPTPQGTFGFGMDFDWASLGLRFRADTVTSTDVDSLSPRTHTELALGPTVFRYVDVGPVSFGFGLYVEGVRHFQTITTAGSASTREAWGAGFAGLVSFETQIGSGVALHLEAGPMSDLFPEAQTQNGTQSGTVLASPLTWWAAGGIVWRL